MEGDFMKKIDFALVGNLSFDYNFFPDRKESMVKNLGGATLYSGIPASLFARVGIAAKVGEDYDMSIFDDLNVDTSGIRVVPGMTTRFHQEFISDDGQERIFKEFVNPNTILKPEDIPESYLNAKYIHVCTNYPEAQLEIVKYLKAHSNAILSIDTLEDYYYDEKQFEFIKEAFDLVDIAFIDKEFEKLMDCKAPTKIVKMGKNGCKFISDDLTFKVRTEVCENVVDKTGAGDCVTGVYGALRTLGYSEQLSLKAAVMIATQSIKGHGMFHLLDDRSYFADVLHVLRNDYFKAVDGVQYTFGNIGWADGFADMPSDHQNLLDQLYGNVPDDDLIEYLDLYLQGYELGKDMSDDYEHYFDEDNEFRDERDLFTFPHEKEARRLVLEMKKKDDL